MWNENEAYFDYLEIRRRIERRLATGFGIVAHTALFVLAVFAGVTFLGSYPGNTLSAPAASFLMLLWAFVLAIHGLWVYQAAGTNRRHRAAAVEAELTERYEAGDTELLASPRHLFRVRSLMDEDVRMRAGWIVGVNAFLLGNVVFWIGLLMNGTVRWAAWPVVPMLAFGWFPSIYAINQVRRRMRDAKVRRILSLRPVSTASAVKQKRSFDSELERYARLSDDGELVDVPEDWAAYDVRRKRG
jgi:hypothetical protein